MDSNFKILYALVVMICQSVNISDIASITVKNVGGRCIIHNISKSEAINLLELENSVLKDRGFI